MKVLLHFIIISNVKRCGLSIWKNSNLLYPRLLFAKLGWNWPSGSIEEEILNFINIFSQFHNYLPLEKSGALHLKKLESPLPKDALCQVCSKLAKWFWRRLKCEKITTTTTMTMDNGLILIRKAHLSLWLTVGELKTKY